MVQTVLPNTSIGTGFQDGEDGWGAVYNRNMRVLDALVQPVVQDMDVVTPPTTPTNGQVWHVSVAATGAWGGQDGKLAIWSEGADLVASGWTFVTPKPGWQVYSIADDARFEYDGSVWAPIGGAGAPTSYTQNFGDGSAAEFDITHNLGTRAVHVTVFRNATPWDTIICDVDRTTTNVVKLYGFSGAPSVDQYTVVVSK